MNKPSTHWGTSHISQSLLNFISLCSCSVLYTFLKTAEVSIVNLKKSKLSEFKSVIWFSEKKEVKKFLTISRLPNLITTTFVFLLLLYYLTTFIVLYLVCKLCWS